MTCKKNRKEKVKKRDEIEQKRTQKISKQDNKRNKMKWEQNKRWRDRKKERKKERDVKEKFKSKHLWHYFKCPCIGKVEDLQRKKIVSIKSKT